MQREPVLNFASGVPWHLGVPDRDHYARPIGGAHSVSMDSKQAAQVIFHGPCSGAVPAEDPQPCRRLETGSDVFNQELKTDGNKMPALIQKACGRKIKWEKRMNVFSEELCAFLQNQICRKPAGSTP